MKKPIEARFYEKIDRIGGCWVWTATRDRLGYGRFRGPEGRNVAAHRFAYELMVGPVPAGLELDHLCRMRACVNPAHLEPVTRRENVLRGQSPSALNAVKTNCPQGHPYDKVVEGERVCRVCNAAAVRRYKARKNAA